VPLSSTVPPDPLAGLVAVPSVAAVVADVRTAVDGVLRLPVLRRRSADVSAESALRGAWASAVMASATTPLEDLRAGDTSDPIVAGALRAYGALGSLTDVWTRAPAQALARLHSLAAAELVGADRLGRPAGGPEVSERLALLSRTLTGSSAPAVVAAAVVVGEILALDAFAPVSPVVAWAAARLTVVERALDPKALTIPEVGALDVPAPVDAYRGGDAAALVSWVGAAFTRGALEATAICEALRRG
jgi:hypothetical protein